MTIKALSRTSLIVGLYFVVAAVPITIGVFRPGITGYDRAMFQDMVYGTAYKPFVKRQLVPLMIRAGTECVPVSVRRHCENALAGLNRIEGLKWPQSYAVEFLFALLIMHVSLAAFLAVLRCFLLIWFTMSSGTAHVVTLVAGLTLPVTFSGNMYIYDFTQLLLFTSGLIFLFANKWFFFYPVYILACVNKETSLLLPVVFGCWLGVRVLRPPMVWHFLGQILAGCILCLFISWIFRHNPGGDVGMYVLRNVSLDFSVLAWLRLFLLFAVTVLAVWKIRLAPPFVSRGFLGTFPVLFLAAFLFGYIDELRDYYEALPFMIVLCLVTVGRCFGIKLKEG